jgi:hypothetical protein
MRVEHTERGFEVIRSRDGKRLVQQSSAIGDSAAARPGSSFLWVGDISLDRMKAAELAARIATWACEGTLVIPGDS